MADAAAKAALKKSELHPGSDAGRNGEAGDAPALLEAEEGGEGEGGEIAKRAGENDAEDGEAERSARIAKSVVTRRIETAEGGGEKSDSGAVENAPNIDDVGVEETAGLVDGGDDDVAESEKADDGGNDEKGDLAKAAVEAGAENLRDFVGGTEGAAHDRKFGGGDGHTEKADGESVESLRVSERGDGAGGEPAGEESVDVSADLNDAATDEDRNEILEDGAHIFGLVSEGEFEATEKFEDGGKLDEDLEGAADDRGPGGDDDEGVLGSAGAEGDHASDHGEVPENGRGVREEELAVAVQDAEAPGGGDEESCAREEDANEKDGEFALFAVEAGSDGVDEPWRGEHTEQDQERGRKCEESGNSTRGFAGFFLVVTGEEIGIDRDKGRGEDTFAEKVLQEIGDAEGGFEDVGSVGIAEVVGENAVANESGNAGEKDAGGDEECETAGAGRLRGVGGGGGGHENVRRSGKFEDTASGLRGSRGLRGPVLEEHEGKQNTRSFNREAVEVVGEVEGAGVAFADFGFGLGFLAQSAQHAMRQDQLFDAGVGSNLADDGGRHVQAAFEAGGALQNGVVGNQEIGVGGELR